MFYELGPASRMLIFIDIHTCTDLKKWNLQNTAKLFDRMTWNCVGWYIEVLEIFSDLLLASCILIFIVMHTCTDKKKKEFAKYRSTIFRDDVKLCRMMHCSTWSVFRSTKRRRTLFFLGTIFLRTRASDFPKIKNNLSLISVKVR